MAGRITDGGAYGSMPWLDLEDGYGAYLVIEADSATGIELAEALCDVVEQAVRANWPAAGTACRVAVRRAETL